MSEFKGRNLGEVFAAHSGNVSDKWEHYPAIYGRELGALVAAGRPVRVLEIGVQNGGSLQIWKDFLPRGSEIVGVEIDPRAADLSLGENIVVHVADATDQEALNNALHDQTFDVIVDDGSHLSSHMVATFQLCFDRLNAGGIYIIEDVHCSYLRSHGGGLRTEGSAVEYFKNIADAVNVDHFEPGNGLALSDAELSAATRLGHTISNITFYDSVIVIRKAEKRRDAPFSRVLTGATAPLADIKDYLHLLPLQQLRTMLLSGAAFEHLSINMLEMISASREETGVIKERVAWLESERQNLRSAAEQKEAELNLMNAQLIALREEFSRSVAERQSLSQEKHRLDEAGVLLQAKMIGIEKEYLATVDQLAAIRGSTLWKMFDPIRSGINKSPRWVRPVARRCAKAVWWTMTGQIFQRIRMWRENRARLRAGVIIHPAASGSVAISSAASNPPSDYSTWRKFNDVDEVSLISQPRLARNLAEQPLFSVLVPVYRTPVDVFAEMIASVQKQTYDKWEICLLVVEEGEITKKLVEKAKDFAAKDKRIKLHLTTVNAGISGNSNAALAIAEGEWTVLLDHDDLITPDALFEFAKAINSHADIGFIYSDKDNVSGNGKERFGPLLKPKWSPETMLNANYLTHFCAMRTAVLRKIGGWDATTDGAQDWDIFLRVISDGGAVVHVPRVLYHWRWLETSVATGGFDAKPYAANGQLKTLENYLPTAGWPGAHAKFEGAYIRIVWDSAKTPFVSVIQIGDRDRNPVDFGAGVEVLHVSGNHIDLATSMDKAIAKAKGEIILLLDSNFTPEDALSIQEMARPLTNPAIALVAARVLDNENRVVDYGNFVENGRVFPAFRGENKDYYGPAGSAGWYRNAAVASGGALAFRKATWSMLGGFSAFSEADRPDLAFTLACHGKKLGRLMLNPFAIFRSTSGVSVFEKNPRASGNTDYVRAILPDGDPYLNPQLEAVEHGAPTLRRARANVKPPAHDFTAEAQGVAVWFDATKKEIEASVAACEGQQAGSVKRVIWIIPEFEVPFYGGVNTILRNAEHMRMQHGVRVAFAVLGGPSVEVMRARISRAFPELAAASEIFRLQSTEAVDLGQADAAICTLWTTAYALLRLKNVRRKFYFVQDWEPLFYPGGTLSQVVEATYRFGFHAIANTPSLSESYKQLGGKGDFFMPSVDTKIFHANGRAARKEGEPFVLASYTRPGTPRNCFEALTEGMRLLKQSYGDSLQIVTAGANWDPAHFGLGGIVRNLGLLPYAETGQLYRAADAGLVAMASRHPSYLPFEWMACGVAVVTNRNAYTEWLLRDGENSLLCEMTRSDIFETVSQLVESPDLRDKIADNALVNIKSGHSDWSKSCERVFDVISQVCGANR
ncbi:rhamnosyltransferase WsaF family glycosyltransferase [Endobacterium cereale]|uniref:rhamnosyltransferase WsaF family glycosyltransferase n=1 Tax=Endobacterium cereale TaxID=2663029 RepID=UPI002B460BE7|nr:glycosyltransferase [Endobacterium cereale]MEB2848293.1 glycosyltransferase [Endobacterium cereale]